MTVAKRAPVRPRVFVDGCSDPLLLEDEIAQLLAAGKRGFVALVGGPGSGKTTALQHLATIFPAGDRFLLLDETDFNMPDRPAPSPRTARDRLVVYATQSVSAPSNPVVYHLANWTKDDAIEYLLATHRPQCASVMARVSDGNCALLGGSPELWRVLLDRLASDEIIPDVRRALHRHLEECLCDTDLVERTRSACLNFVLAPGAETTLTQSLKQLAKPDYADVIRVVRHPAAQIMLASERIAADLHGDGDCDYLAKILPRELVRATWQMIADDAGAIQHLQRLLDGPSWSHAMSASLLHAAGIHWTPPPRNAAQLAGAYLNGIAWSGVDLSCADLQGADLSEAYLSGATLTGANARGANLSRASMQGATLFNFFAAEADLSYAKLSRVVAHEPAFGNANLHGADFTEAMLHKANFVDADLTKANFRGACLSGAAFLSTSSEPNELRNLSEVVNEIRRRRGGADTGRRFDGADFTNANLTEADLSCLDLRSAVWTHARFAQAKLQGCNLETLSLPGADFTGANLHGALLTGTIMPGASFKAADLRQAGLAEVEWEGVNLSNADLRDASFHLGSTRSGLVGSPIASEGSRTGFYTDDYDEQTHLAPEEIRKANLCGADLRGADVEEADFYLVDLRDALFDEWQGRHFRRCRAILGKRDSV